MNFRTPHKRLILVPLKWKAGKGYFFHVAPGWFIGPNFLSTLIPLTGCKEIHTPDYACGKQKHRSNLVVPIDDSAHQNEIDFVLLFFMSMDERMMQRNP
jgi:hypothetical protein